jgi:ATP-dependent Lhr-like helicase
VDSRRRTVFVTRVKGKVQTYWKGGGYKIHDRILEKMRAVLLCQTQYPYLQKNAKARISESRFMCQYSGLGELNVVSLGGKTVCILPWAGTVDFVTILYLLRKYMADYIDSRSVGGWTPYFITAKLTGGTVWELLAQFQALLAQPLNILEDIGEDDLDELKGSYEYKPAKYEAFIPKELQKKAIIADYINLDRIAARAANWTCGSIAEADGDK